MTPAAIHALISALHARAASWLPCEVTPGELARDWSGPPPAITGRMMHEAMIRDAVLDALEQSGVAARYDRRRRAFMMRRAPARDVTGS